MRCPCCGFKTLNQEDELYFEICPVCFWENDPIQNNNANYSGGANSISLFEAKKNFKKFGAILEEYVSLTRKPYDTEK